MCLDASVTAASHQVLPAGYWWSLLYGTVIALLCLLVCLVGAHIYAKATFLIFLVVMFVLCTIFISFFAAKPHTISLPSSASPNGSGPVLPTTANFTGFKLDTLLGNLWGKVHKSKTYLGEWANTNLFLPNFPGDNLLNLNYRNYMSVNKNITLFTV